MSRKLNLQTIFNKAYRHFVLKGNKPCVRRAPSLRTGFRCYYEYRGRECAVGVALPEGHKARRCPTQFSGLIGKFPELFVPALRDTSEHRLDAFQNRLHDGLIDKQTLNWKEGIDLKAEYEAVAADYGLTVPQK